MSGLEMKGRVELFSPVPPMRTGTASYLAEIVRRMAAIESLRPLMRIAIDPDFLPDGPGSVTELEGVEVAPFADFETEVPVGSSRILFVANNDHHAYVQASLARMSSRAQGRIIVVLHDTSVFMLNRFMYGQSRLSKDELVDRTAPQYGSRAGRLVEARLAGHMPDLFEFVTHTQALALSRAHEIWVHSIYSLVKLLTETDLHANMFPRMRVCAHPAPDVEDVEETDAALEDTGRQVFRIGIFGWVTSPKRVTSVIRGLALALDRLPSGKRDGIELVIVGRLPPETSYDPAGEASRFDVADRVRFIDYPSDVEFAELQSSCQLIFNLRYPSCGETSGTLASARATRAALVTSRYQAFHETGDNSAATVTVLPCLEDWSIAAVICEAIENASRTAGAARAPAAAEIAPVEKLVLREILGVAVRQRHSLAL